MGPSRPAIASIALLALAGCGGGVSSDNLPPEQRTAEYGKQSSDKMKSMYTGLPEGKPGAGAVAPPPKPSAGQSASDKMRSMYGRPK